MLMQYTVKRVYYGRCVNGKLQAGIKKKLNTITYWLQS